MKLHLLPLPLALLGVAGLAQAELVTASGAAAFNGSASVTATASSVASATASLSGTPVATGGVSQFDASNGVLTGASIALDSSRAQTLSGVGNKSNGPGRDANGSGTSTALLEAPGASTSFSAPITATGTGCSLAMGPTGPISCSWGPVQVGGVATQSTATVDSASLNAYVGSGTTNVALSLPNLQATSTLSRTQGQASSAISTYTVGWSGNVQASYSYLLHAAPSFDAQAQMSALTLDFGTVAQGSSVGPLSFMIYNHPDAQRVGLDLDSFSLSGSTGAFSTDLAGFSNLAAGEKQSFEALLNTSTVGSFGSQVLLTLSDADVGASSTRGIYQMQLNLVGNVAAVPEPETYAMLMVGLGVVTGVARRRRNAVRPAA